MPSILQSLLETYAIAKKERDRDMQRHDETLSSLKAMILQHSPQWVDSDEEDKPTTKAKPKVVTSKRFQGMTMPQAARVVLQESGGGPLKSSEIAERLLSGGYQTGSNNFTNVVYVGLREANGFGRTLKGLWFYKEGLAAGHTEVPADEPSSRRRA